MKHLVRQMENGGNRLLSEMGLEGPQIKMVWTIVNEEKLFTQYDSQTGVSRKVVDLQEVKPVHWISAFVEDCMHDWYVRKGDDGEYRFYYEAHSSEIGSKQDLLIET